MDLLFSPLLSHSAHSLVSCGRDDPRVEPSLVYSSRGEAREARAREVKLQGRASAGERRTHFFSAVPARWVDSHVGKSRASTSCEMGEIIRNHNYRIGRCKRRCEVMRFTRREEKGRWRRSEVGAESESFASTRQELACPSLSSRNGVNSVVL